jgi:uncharacterized membrane protein
MMRRYLDLILLFVVTIIVLVLQLINVEGGIVMKLTGAVFVLFAPGYAVMAAVFKEDVLEPSAKIALGIGISLAISAVGAIGLYGIGALLTRTSWTFFLVIIILGCSIVAVVQRSRDTFYMPNFVAPKLSFSEILLLMFSLLALGGGIYLARTAAQNQAYVPFTEFWVVPQSKDVSEIEIGIRNYEQTKMVYELKIRINGRDVEAWSNISVQPDQEWTRVYTLPPKLTYNETIVVYLYTDKDSSKPYRWGQIYR